MNDTQMPTPDLESFIEILSGLSSAAFLKAVDSRGSFDLTDLQMQQKGAEFAVLTECMGLQLENPQGTGGLLIFRLVADPALGQNDADEGATASSFLGPFVEELVRISSNQLPKSLQCRQIDMAEVNRRLREESGSSCTVKFIAVTVSQPKEQEIICYLSPSLCAAIDRPLPKPAKNDLQNRPQLSTAPASPSAMPGGMPRNIDLIMDIELGITVGFGQTRMLLKDVMQLGTGSIVELDRQADEQVDLWVNNKKGARGEVVIVGGNYGVRISEVAALADRISTLAG